MTDNLTERVKDALALDEKRTLGEWNWNIHDPSTASLGVGDCIEHFVLDVSPCQSCCKDETEWKWGRCTTPTLGNAEFIAAAPSFIQLIRELEAARLEAIRQLQEAQKDAERYRWLRQYREISGNRLPFIGTHGPSFSHFVYEAADGIIDAAIQTKEQGS